MNVGVISLVQSPPKLIDLLFRVILLLEIRRSPWGSTCARYGFRTGRRNRVFEVPEVIREYTLLERKLASPVGDTSVEPPLRPVPERPRP